MVRFDNNFMNDGHHVYDCHQCGKVLNRQEKIYVLV